MPDASVEIDLDRLAQPADYFAPIFIGAMQFGELTPQFNGTVISARPDRRNVGLEAQGGASFAETLVGEMAAQAIRPAELIYALARGAGFPSEQLDIEGLDRLPDEMFEVLAPVQGLRVEQRTDFAGVRFLPGLGVIERLRRTLDASDELWSAFEADVFALVLVSSRLCLEAEESALRSIDLALAWLTACLRYGLATMPDGLPVPFVRADSLASPRRGEHVFLRGLTSTRRWLRQPANVEAQREVTLDRLSRRFVSELPPLSLQERLAVLALARAASERDLLVRVHALFEAIEFYASGTTVEPLFTNAERRRVVDALPDELTDGQRKRAVHLASGLNNAPLRIRLIKALDEDGVPLVREADVDLLWALRELRNDVTHGRSSRMPALHEVEHATSIVSRMLMYRIARKLGSRRDPANQATRSPRNSLGIARCGSDG